MKYSTTFVHLLKLANPLPNNFKGRMNSSLSKNKKKIDPHGCFRNHDIGTPVISTIYLAAHASVRVARSGVQARAMFARAEFNKTGGQQRDRWQSARRNICCAAAPPPIDALFPLPFSCAAGTMRAVERCASIGGMREKKRRGGKRKKEKFVSAEGSSSILAFRF